MWVSIAMLRSHVLSAKPGKEHRSCRNRHALTATAVESSPAQNVIDPDIVTISSIICSVVLVATVLSAAGAKRSNARSATDVARSTRTRADRARCHEGREAKARRRRSTCSSRASRLNSATRASSPRGTKSLRTFRWREMGSNCQSRGPAQCGHGLDLSKWGRPGRASQSVT